jgi:hypothetical protein
MSATLLITRRPESALATVEAAEVELEAPAPVVSHPEKMVKPSATMSRPQVKSLDFFMSKTSQIQTPDQ